MVTALDSTFEWVFNAHVFDKQESAPDAIGTVNSMCFTTDNDYMIVAGSFSFDKTQQAGVAKADLLTGDFDKL
jgi:hypothetical protein